eukprot:5329033-Amphidinium_carterae.2
MFFQLVGTERKVKENPAWSREAQVFLGANFSRLQMQVDGVMKDVIIEGSRPGYVKNALIQAGVERSETVLVHVSERTAKGALRAQADSDWAGCHSTPEHSCGMIWWGGVLISAYARTQSTIATSSAESECYGACACASEAAYEGTLEQLVADKTIKLVKVKGTQHPPDVATKYLSKQGMIHAKSMLMEPESLAAFGYKVPEAEGVRDKLLSSQSSMVSSGSSMVANIGIASLLSGRELDGWAVSF